ncbi:tetratricopeptide repeat protein [Aestuariirhabdus sp. LZHN29]|uniref:tetratricopeptide repeat protein n=1 Tax=Aestuariirhabdus sp. LZHN29 TaxID=3417462 RepID=UPI003CEBDD49
MIPKWVVGACKVLGVSLGAILVGCASRPEYYYVPEQDPGRELVPQIETDRSATPDAPSPEAGDTYSYVDPAPGALAQRPAGVIQLVSLSEQQLSAAQFDAAAASLERALRIAPDDADLYYRLGSVRLQQGQFAQAEQLARRGLSIVHDTEQRAQLQRLIEQAQIRARG